MKLRTVFQYGAVFGLAALVAISPISSTQPLWSTAEETTDAALSSPTVPDTDIPSLDDSTGSETDSSNGLTSEEINTITDLQQQRAILQQQATQLEAARQYYTNSLEGLTQQRENIEQQILLKQKEIALNLQLKEQIAEQIETTDQQLTLTEQQITEHEAAIAEQYEQLKQKLRTMSKGNAFTALQMLISSDSYADYLINAKMVSRMTEVDQTTLNSLEDELEQIRTQRKLLSTQRATLEEQQQPYSDAELALEQSKNDLLSLRAQADAVLTQLNTNITYYRQQYTLVTEQQTRLQNQINEILKDQSAIGTVLTSAVMYWPAPGCSVITSSFKERWGRQHYGIDIADWTESTGYPIVAAADGVVLFTGWDEDGYGNYLMIDHGYDTLGRRIITLYAHCQTIYAQTGDLVLGSSSVIAAMGSTGNSTGAHLHFEVRVDGTAVDAVGSGYLSTEGITIDG